MTIRGWCFCCLAFVAAMGPMRADEPPPVPASRTVGSVYGQDITAADVGLKEPIDISVKFDARDTARWQQMGRIMAKFGNPVMERFLKEHRVEAAAEEIATFKKTMRAATAKSLREWEARIAELDKQLAAPNLSEEDKAKYEKERAQLQRLAKSMRETNESETPDELARSFIVAWKTERELHRAYGGRVIFQQAGPEALDARRRLFEAAEKQGDLKFTDPGVRHLFYYYANMRHVFIDAKALEQPWFLGGMP